VSPATIYAASSLSYVALSAAHGGCGNPHRRPVEHGAPAKLWALTCPACENHLRGDPLWSPTISEIPETYDEKIAREDYETRGAKDRDYIQALALARIAGVEIPESLTRVLSGAMAHVPGQLLCPAGHANPAGKKFCGDCGQPMHGEPAAAAIEGPETSFPLNLTPRDDPGDAGADPASLNFRQLRAALAARGLPQAGSKAELLERLRQSGAKAAA